MMNTIEGGVTAAKGFMAASAEAGIKYKNRTDMALSIQKARRSVQELLQRM